MAPIAPPAFPLLAISVKKKIEKYQDQKRKLIQRRNQDQKENSRKKTKIKKETNIKKENI